jgi:hypothetical protein
VALALWIAFIGLIVLDWLQRNAEQRVMRFMTLTYNDGVLTGHALSNGLDDRQLLRVIPDLKDLKSLTSLDLSGTKVVRIAPLKDLKSLTSLNLDYTLVADIAPLKDLKSLGPQEPHDPQSVGHAGREYRAPEGPQEPQEP